MEKLRYRDEDFWKNYMEHWFGSSLISQWETSAELKRIESNDRQICLEVYDSGDKAAPTIVFSHGIAGYARVLLPFILPLYKKGYNFVVPDLQGYGYNDGLKGDFEWNAHVRNLVDCVDYAGQRFKGQIYLGGASMGGPLAYAAACERIEKIDGLCCWCLWDFSDKEFLYNETQTGKFTFILQPLLRLLSLMMGKARIKTYELISYDTLTGSADFNELIKKDPQAGTQITVKGALSLLTQSRPAVLHKNFNIPVLLVQPAEDKMTPPHYMKKTFDSLGSEYKKYVEIARSEHFPLDSDIYDKWTCEVDGFISALKDK